ncbi:F-box only protein 4 [Eurytemora carolleeae]|uniref:F-box only protein 4 n=1 Tax=Eurytemora carolleeae TaxID=1294199 RepID=UPI000C772041|nr:F-box only protein 4 [Eurytemora carolleeae]|eukprot:XP_023334215.1 F-box only protein 4-like [Eurytemora affinis]
MCMCFRKIRSKQKAARKGGFVRMLKDQEKEFGIGGHNKTGLFDLPEEIIHQIVSFLSLQDLCQVGATCRYAYGLTHNEQFWAFQMLKDCKLLYIPEPSGLKDCWPNKKFPVDGVLCDPNLQGNRELFIIYSAEFRRMTREKWNKKKRKDPFRTMLESNSVVKDILPRLLAFYVNLPQEEQCSARLVLFGPGIESERTQDLVHKIVNARSSTFDAVEFIRGLQGGVGSGVRINYKHMYNFDLMCLYTNRQNERLSNKGETRLNPVSNITIIKDSSGNLTLRPEIVKLLPTLHALVFALDVTLEEEDVMNSLALMRKELDILLQGLSTFNMTLPLVVMACSEGQRSACIPVQDIITGLQLEQFNFAWGVWKVEVENMRGAEKGFDWVLHHLRKKRKDWNYHTLQGQYSYPH